MIMTKIKSTKPPAVLRLVTAKPWMSPPSTALHLASILSLWPYGLEMAGKDN